MGQRLSSMLLICLASLFMATALTSMGPVLPTYCRDFLGASVTEVGIIMSVGSLTAIIARPFMGYMVGKIKKQVYLLSAIVVIPLVLARALVKGPREMILINGFLGVFIAAFDPISITLVTEIVPRNERDRALITYTTFVSLGLIVGPFLGSITIPSIGVRGVFYVAPVLVIIGALMASQIRSEGIEKEPPVRSSFKSSLRRVLFNKFVAMTIVTIFLFFFLFGVVATYGPLYAKKTFLMTESQISLMFLGYYTALMLSRIFMRKLVSRLKRRVIMCIGLSAASAIAVLLYLSESSFQFNLFFVILGVSHGIFFPSGVLVVAGAVEESDITLANCILFNFLDIGYALGSLTMAPVAEIRGLSTPFLYSAIFPIIGILAIVIASKK